MNLRCFLQAKVTGLSARLSRLARVDNAFVGLRPQELLQQLAHQGIRISAIVITAYGPLMYKRCIEAGAVACLSKPLPLARERSREGNCRPIDGSLTLAGW